MDTTETYIKMCEEAPREVRDSALTNANLLVYAQKVKEGYAICYGWKDYLYDEKILESNEPQTNWLLNLIPLPRQDQLQEMSGEEYAINLLYQFHRYYNTKYRDIPGNWSMEQLWLAFVMKEKYNKVWNGEEWGINPH